MKIILTGKMGRPMSRKKRRKVPLPKNERLRQRLNNLTVPMHYALAGMMIGAFLEVLSEERKRERERGHRFPKVCAERRALRLIRGGKR